MLNRSLTGRAFRFAFPTALALALAPGASRGASFSDVRVPFVANSGQTDPSVAYYAPTFAGTVFVTRDGRIVYSLPAPRTPETRSPGGGPAEEPGSWSLAERAVRGNSKPSAGNPSPVSVSQFLGNDPSRWRGGLPAFETVSLGKVWPRISVELRARGKSAEKLFTVEPGGDPSRIRMAVDGALSLRIDRAGALVVRTGPGDVAFTPPSAWQERGGARLPVRVAYRVRGREYGFRLGAYDRSLPVRIDPLLQSTYLGGSAFEGLQGGSCLAIHPTSGEVYVAGETASTNFPGTAGGAQAANAGSHDAFVARFNPALTTLLGATYLGGSSSDGATALAIHPSSGEIYVVGITFSSDFPGTAGGAQPGYHGGVDSFIARFNPALTSLDGATYLGGSAFDTALAVAIHPGSGDVYVAGQTASANFPATAGGAQAALHGSTDAFIARVNSALTAFGQATYLGGTGTEAANGVAVHPASGDVYVSGSTDSTDFPATAGGAQPANAGSFDLFVARVNPALTALGQATYFGGSGDESNPPIAIHPATGDVYSGGFTNSTDLPGTAGGAQPSHGGGSQDGFAARWNPALTALGQATYLGGSSFDLLTDLAIHPITGEVYAAGITGSTDFPGRAGGAQDTYGGGLQDGFAARWNAALTALRQATYLGGSGSDVGRTVAIHPLSGDAYVGGETDSTNFPGAAGGAQPGNAGGNDAFLARLTRDLAATSSITDLSPAKIWVGLADNRDAGIRLDLRAEVSKNGDLIGSGELDGVHAGESGFKHAILQSIPLALASPTPLASGDELSIQVLARIACSGSPKASGTARLWYDGQPVDAGNDRDAGSRFDATISGTDTDFFLRSGSALSTTPGPSRTFTDASIATKCGPFQSFGTWTTTVP